ncbi:M15 family metallopeptidase [Borreliella burgdorferi]|uniref:M15 family metallopeptidase n=1 Tax=Borreliella burgdorferi TaxID=139 RepID=UPI00017F3128|nr:D-alanyl-D-alanine carboxypeptidase family protein [Borreliella burgdorferi]EOA79949.1 D-alanyl-D-alanine carboxypeptidase [Borreliella burgdorferi CA8]PRR37474.1 D-alanyl-D-alanine carboxypeptidase [Borreliella burgdorferi]QXG44278.1 D-alanyl-D-alanine carboxypeptidase family protein [Borreliella burgdorferi]WKC96435.1 D-alanyl-D-alanine carboxypeptidase family protein [Borreliella burgdorferi]WKC97351.1 D-alanyl-D-alanine carboxypeptidase family protein [Borreliella burgdorferi]
MKSIYALLFLFINLSLLANNISKKDLEVLLKIAQAMNKECKNFIEKNPIQFLKEIKPLVDAEKNNLLTLINKKIPIPENYKIPDLVNIDDFEDLKNLGAKTIKVRKILIEDLIRLIKDAKKFGIEIKIKSAYRTQEYQKFLFDYNVKTYGRKVAETQSAIPGHSQHHMGTAIDFINIDDNLLNTKEGKWLYKNSLKYGFSVSYPKGYETETGYKAEPWHYLYIGPKPCFIQKKYFNNLQHKLLEFWNQNKTNLINLIEKYAN